MALFLNGNFAPLCGLSENPIVFIMKRNKGVVKAIREAGGQSALARLCGCAQSTVWEWANRQCPPSRAVQIEEVTGVSRSEIRPDIFKK